METKEINKVCLERVRLKGFRTIEDIAVDFQPGLNIIIGQNGVGKSNFLEYLNRALELQVDPLQFFDAALDFLQEKGSPFTVTVQNQVSELLHTDLDQRKKHSPFVIRQKGETETLDFMRGEELEDHLLGRDCPFSPTFIPHGLPMDYELVDEPISLSAAFHGGVDFSISSKNRSHSYPRFLRNLKRYLFKMQRLESDNLAAGSNRYRKNVGRD